MLKHFKDYFIPHRGNGYKPHSLQTKAVLGMAGLVLLSFTVVNLQSVIWSNSIWLTSSVLPSVLIDLTNKARVDNSLETLSENTKLDIAAQLKAQDMAKYEYFAHYSPTGVSPWYWFNRVDYSFVNAGENLAINFLDSEDVVQAWLDSPSHRDNILKGEYTEIGIGAVAGMYEDYKTVYVVQMFGTPAKKPITTITKPKPTVVTKTQDSSLVQVNNEISVTGAEAQIAGSEEIVKKIDNTEVSLSTDRDSTFVSSKNNYKKEQKIINENTEISDVKVSDNSIIVFSDTVSTTTGGIPAIIKPDNTVKNTGISVELFGFATKPQLLLQVLYSIIGLFVLVSLILSIIIEFKKQHPVQIVYGGGLIAVMIGLFYIHLTLTSGIIIL